MTLPDFRLEVYLGRWEFAARHHLTASDAETLTIGELLELAGDDGAFARLPLSYTPTRGTPELLEAIAALYERVEPEDVLTFAGAEEAMFWALPELVGPGEHAVVTVPNYQSMETLAVASGAAVDGLVLRPHDGWAPDLDALERLLRPETTLVAVNFPNNPTGALPARATFARLVELCDERGIRLFSDEVYRGLELDPATTLPQPTSTFCRRLVERAGVVLLPADVYASDLGEVPEDRFRIGVGRRDPAPALAAFGDFLSGR